jgi:hypothetical protein
MVKGMLGVIVVGVPLVIVVMLLELELVMVAVGWQVWVFWMVSVGLFKVELGVVVVK